MKRVFDILFSFFGLVLVLPLFGLIIISMKITTKGPIIYKQLRVGINNNDFFIFKFRTMFVNADKLGLLTVGERDPRVTKIGFYLRKYKLDELPQLINVFCGDMSFVGPRPEVRKYVDLYNPMQMQVLNVRPGITDLASIEFRNENELLSCQENPDRYYIEVVMPQKLQINLNYLEKRNLIKDIGVIISTFWSIFKN
jgi:lipopolysaccharide/colanic/teichoic acid biosynthesis glycosyltransferase